MEETGWRVRSRVAVVLAAVWFAGLIVAVALDPLLVGQSLAAKRILELAAPFVMLGVILFLSLLAGRRILGCLRVQTCSSLEEAVFAIALGLGALSIIMLVLGLCGGLYTGVAYGLLALGALILVPGSLRRRSSGFSPVGGTGDGRVAWDPMSIGLACVLGIAAFIYLPAVFSPPLNYDSLTYHIGIPKLFVHHHRVFNVPNNVYAQFPAGMEMLYMLGLLLRGDILAKFIHFSAGALAALGIVAFSLRHFGSGAGGMKAGLASAVIFYTMPLVGFLSGWLYNDLGLVLFQFLSAAALLAYLYPRPGRDEPGWLKLSGILAGLSLSVKLSAAPLSCLVLAGIILWAGLARRRPARAIAGELAVFVSLCLLAALPWLVKSAVYTGNPVYPFLARWFEPFTARAGQVHFDAQRFMAAHLPGGRSPGRVVGLLWELSAGKEIGPALLLFLPMLVFFRGVRPQVKAILGYGAASFVVWACATYQEPRFLLGALPLVCLAAGCGFARLADMRPGRYLAAGALAAVCVLNLFWAVTNAGGLGLLGLLSGTEEREEYLLSFAERHDGRLYQYPVFDYINRALPPDARILFVGENQGYYCDREFVGASPFDVNPIVTAANRSNAVGDLAAWLREEGFTHMLVNLSELSRTERTVGSLGWTNPRSRGLFIALFEEDLYTKLLFEVGPVRLYEVL